VGKITRGSVACVVGLALVVAACGGDDDSADDGAGAPATEADTSESEATEPETTEPETTEPETTEPDTAEPDTTAAVTAPDTEEPEPDSGAEAEAALAELYAAAQADGSVTVYSSQALDGLNQLAEAFEARYPGVDAEIVRAVDTEAIPRVETEIATGTSGGDLVVVAAQAWVETQGAAGSFADPTASPQIGGLGDYDAAAYLHEGNFFEVGAAVLTFGWNTDGVPDGLTDYPDLLDPELADGKIGVIDPAISPAVVDFYLWLEETYGPGYVEGLAAQSPRIYPSALPTGEALASGEILAAIFAAPAQMQPAKDSGAPLDFAMSPAGAWGSRFFGAIPASSDHQAAAALFADFMVTAEGQGIVQYNGGSVIPDVPGTLVTNDRIRKPDVEATAPDPAAAYVDAWNDLFR